MLLCNKHWFQEVTAESLDMSSLYFTYFSKRLTELQVRQQQKGNGRGRIDSKKTQEERKLHKSIHSTAQYNLYFTLTLACFTNLSLFILCFKQCFTGQLWRANKHKGLPQYCCRATHGNIDLPENIWIGFWHCVSLCSLLLGAFPLHCSKNTLFIHAYLPLLII